MKYTTRVLAVVAIMAAALIGGCTSETRQAAPEQTVEERAQARWDYLVARNPGEAWEFLTPGYRERTSRDHYARLMSGRPVRWQSAEVLGADCEGDRCEVQARVTYNVPGARHGQDRLILDRTLQEVWVRIDGQWWHVAD